VSRAVQADNGNAAPAPRARFRITVRGNRGLGGWQDIPFTFNACLPKHVKYKVGLA
jgi:hypothetical protein